MKILEYTEPVNIVVFESNNQILVDRLKINTSIIAHFYSYLTWITLVHAL